MISALSELSAAQVLAIAGLISALGGFIGTITSTRATRRETQAECDEKLRDVRLEASELADKLYELRRRDLG